MENPFPGMNPYLESRWQDVHLRLIAYMADQLNERLPRDSAATTRERVAVQYEGIAVAESFKPDVTVLSSSLPEHDFPEPASPGATMTQDAVRLVLAEPDTEKFIEIIEVSTHRLITVIELISPSNKRNPGLREYLKKRRSLMATDVNLVEIDLVRQGSWKRLLKPHQCPSSKETLYRATVRFASDPLAVYLVPISLRQQLPKLEIPLRENDGPVHLEIQPLLNKLYLQGRLAQLLDYRKPVPDPPLSTDDAAWCEEILRNAGLRPGENGSH